MLYLDVLRKIFLKDMLLLLLLFILWFDGAEMETAIETEF